MAQICQHFTVPYWSSNNHTAGPYWNEPGHHRMYMLCNRPPQPPSPPTLPIAPETG